MLRYVPGGKTSRQENAPGALAVNCGSSTLKFRLASGGTTLADGSVDRIGDAASLQAVFSDGSSFTDVVAAPGHGEAVRAVLQALESRGLLDPPPDVVGHRVVHGGPRFVGPALINDHVVREIETLRELAPLHNEPALVAIRASGEALGPGVPMVAVFDTAFFAGMPEKAALYAIPMDPAVRYGVRRYGFHGLAHRWMTERYATLASKPMTDVRIITLQLGAGCSGAAIEGGRPADTSMGFTPLEGLIMRTRSGDVDPSLVAYLAERQGVTAGAVVEMLNRESGLLGISGSSGDMRDLLAAEAKGDERAALAVEMFCYRVRKCIGAYMAVMGGVDAIVFGGGLGENQPEVRARICRGMEWCGLALDEDKNASAAGAEARISADGRAVEAYVIPVDESAIIIRDALDLLRSEESL